MKKLWGFPAKYAGSITEEPFRFLLPKGTRAVPDHQAPHRERGQRGCLRWDTGWQAASCLTQPEGSNRDKKPREKSCVTVFHVQVYRPVLSTKKHWQFQLPVLWWWFLEASCCWQTKPFLSSHSCPPEPSQPLQLGVKCKPTGNILRHSCSRGNIMAAIYLTALGSRYLYFLSSRSRNDEERLYTLCRNLGTVEVLC